MNEKIQIITREEANKILDSPGEKYEPFGRYLISDKIEGFTIWTAIDNTTGEAFTEEYWSKEEAIRYLENKPSFNLYGQMIGKR